MVTRRFATALMLVLAVAGCADNTTESGAAGPAPSASDVIDLPSATPSTEPSAGKPTATGAETITGTVTAGVEPHCLLLQDDKGSHLLVFDDTALRLSAAVGAKVTLTGRSEPSMMSTCQQGVPFIVTSVSSSGS
jgi:hypothetical protein